MPNNIIMADKATGEWTSSGIAQGLEPNGDITVDGISIIMYAFADSSIRKFRGTNLTLPGGAKPFMNSSVEVVFLNANNNAQPNGLLQDCKQLKIAVLILPNIRGSAYSLAKNSSNLETFDITSSVAGFQVAPFMGCAKLKTIIFRDERLYAISGASDFSQTPFASGGSGGTIYIPKTLFDHLGDGTSLDYKAANGWSTLDGYGTITWAKIEGSIYETQYADGTPISAEG